MSAVSQTAAKPAESPESHLVQALRFKEKTLLEKIEKLKGMDEAAHARAGHELGAAKSNADRQLAEVRAEIKKATK